MNHFIESIDIQNFKSIRQLHIAGLNRINLFIGRPNVGKSNILEALSLFGLPFVWEGSKKLTDLVRFQSAGEFFHEGTTPGSFIGLGSFDRIFNCNIGFDKRTAELSIYVEEDVTAKGFPKPNDRRLSFSIDVHAKLTEKTGDKYAEVIKPYIFKTGIKLFRTNHLFLQPPFGNNLLQALELLPELRQLFGQWFRQYGLKLVLDIATQSIKVQKDKSEDEVFILPYSSIADTLQRIVFYKTAIRSNQNSVLLFEEPEAHAYPQYISEFTQEVIRSTTNQFFIVTHSPYVVGNFLEDEEAFNDLAIFMVDFKDGQTVTRPLTKEELIRVRRYGIDLFFNGDQFLTDGRPYSARMFHRH